MPSFLCQLLRVSCKYDLIGFGEVPHHVVELFARTVRTVKFACSSDLGMLGFDHCYTPLATNQKASSSSICGGNIMQLQLELADNLVPGNSVCEYLDGTNVFVGFLLGRAGG